MSVEHTAPATYFFFFVVLFDFMSLGDLCFLEEAFESSEVLVVSDAVPGDGDGIVDKSAVHEEIDFHAADTFDLYLFGVAVAECGEFVTL